MIVVNCETVAEMEVLARVIESARWRGARLDDVRLVFIGRQPSSTVATALAAGATHRHDGLMTRRTAARELTCSTSTVDRLAKAGRIVKIGGRITATSVGEYMRGER